MEVHFHWLLLVICKILYHTDTNFSIPISRFCIKLFEWVTIRSVERYGLLHFCMAPDVCRRKNKFSSFSLKGRILNIMLDRIALVFTIIGALNWGSIGLFRFDLVAWLFGGQEAILSRIVYTVVALAGVWCISLLFRERESEVVVGDIR